MSEPLADALARAPHGNLHKEGEKLARQNKLFVRERIEMLCDAGSFVEDGLLANANATDLPADGVITGVPTASTLLTLEATSPMTMSIA